MANPRTTPPSSAAPTVPPPTVRGRHHETLRHALGPLVAAALAEPDVVEVMANPDGSLWADRIGRGRERIGTIDPAAADAAVRLLATHMGEEVNPARPAVGGTLPATGERFQGLLPPLVAAPAFAIRKRPAAVFTLDDYVAQGVMTAEQRDELRRAVEDRRNIVIAGGTGSGKTTLANAVLAEPAFARDRVVVLEDTRELQCSSPDRVELLTRQADPPVTMTDLLRTTLRLRPDRIVVGEVRGPEALALVKAWNTGHPGGLATVHANSADDAVRRLEDLCGEAAAVVPRAAIAAAVQVVAFIERTAGSRRVTGLLCPSAS